MEEHRLHVRFNVFTAVAMKNAVFLMLRRLGLARPDVSEERVASIIRVKIISELGTMKNGVFLDVTSCGSCKNRRFRGT
jgi:hypothetical protein